MKYLNRFFWWCAGTNIEVLEKCPTDQSKYFGVGGTIVFTALMASFAGGYAFFTAFKSPLLSIIFGIFWGLLIFNLDRYIVSTIGKGDGTQKITKEEWKIAAPRLTMAVLLGFVIAVPLELKIFETEIQTVVERLKIEKGEELGNADVTFNNDFQAAQERLTRIETDLKELTNNKQRLTQNAGQFYEDRRKELIADSNQKDTELKAIQNRVNNFHSNYLVAIKDSLSPAEINRRKSLRDQQITTRNQIRIEKDAIDQEVRQLSENRGNAIQQEQDKIDTQIAMLITQQQNLDNRIAQMQTIKDAKGESIINNTENYDGFAAHLEAMSVLTEIKKNDDGNWVIPAMFYAKWLITLLLIFIEVAPVLFKLMTESGPYDDIMERIKHESKVREKHKISDLNDEINTSIQISTHRNKSRLDAELKANDELLTSIALAQADIAKRAVEKWKEKEILKLDQSLNHIIISNEKPQLIFHDKFWSLGANGPEYFFRNGNSKELLIKDNGVFKTGEWSELNNTVCIKLNDQETSYNIKSLTDSEFSLSDAFTGDKLNFILR